MEQSLTKWTAEELIRNLKRREENERGYHKMIDQYEAELLRANGPIRIAELKSLIGHARHLLGKNLARQVELIDELEGRDTEDLTESGEPL
jgi:hypothetical protein